MLIHYYLPDGRGATKKSYSVDLDKMLLINSENYIRKVCDSNILAVKTCIEQNITFISDRITQINAKLEITESQHIKIEGGYKTVTPVTDSKRKVLTSAINNLLAEMSSIKESNLYVEVYRS